ncbi:hypothetical protein LV83_04237 [Algoriphagus yeomjeoni]|uniref:Uncharacterized protein n=1 Tax=Algoriphagus yeomjeoni TaxID=291403 RepID=A0A327NWX1_9BACT|nr:hypothetical protein LV83_04237 [Algoriphagus yeomjeoni]
MIHRKVINLATDEKADLHKILYQVQFYFLNILGVVISQRLNFA